MNNKNNKLKHLKNFDMFTESAAAAEPKVKPATPMTKPETKPGRPTPFPTKKPSVDPKPKAKKK
jgi:hypothetical protein